MVNSLSNLVEPSGFATALFLLGVACTVTRRTRRYSLALAAASGLVLLVFSNGLVATLLMSPLEYEYPALHDPTRHPEARTIVVLTGWAADDDVFPLSAKMNSASAFRVLEAANLHAARPDCRVLVSGSDVAARIMHQQLQRLGVPDQALLIDSESANTAASAARARELLGDAPVFLVSSAGHMRRAIWTFQQQGVRVIAAPTDHLLPRSPWNASWTTSALHLQASDLAAHEYVGLAWYRLRSLSSLFASDHGAQQITSQ
jgi:uncharacterized SAM-binding protein YcdF (DUF218 family)